MKNFTLTAGAALILSLSLAACSQNFSPTPTRPAPPVVQLPASLTGRVNPVPNAGALAQLLLPTAALNVVAQAPVAVDGQFELTLPDAAGMAPYLSDLTGSVTNRGGCSGTFPSSDPALRGRFVSTLYLREGGVVTGFLAQGAFGNDAGVLTYFGRGALYADRAGTLSGTVTCVDAGTTYTYTANLALQPGWNATAVAARSPSGALDYRITAGTLAAESWTFTPDTSSLRGQGVGASPAQLLAHADPFGN